MRSAAPATSTMQTAIALLGLGANMADPAGQIDTALERLAALPGVQLRARSDLYQTPAWGDTNQPDFLNAAAAFTVTLAPMALLAALLEIERAIGRVRTERRWGPRLIDLDLLAFGGRVLHVDGLQLPHPGIAERAFVLVPLLDLADRVPGLPTTRWRRQLSDLHHADVIRIATPNRPQSLAVN